MNTARTGYTFIEIMLAVAIIGIMVGIVVVNYSGNKNFNLLRSKTEELASALRAARNRDFGGNTTYYSGTSAYQYPPGGYGLRIVAAAADCKATYYPPPDTTTVPKACYFLFADHGSANPQSPAVFDGIAAGELVQRVDVSDDLNIVLEVGAQQAEIVFKNGAMTIYHDSPGWTEYTAGNPNTYVITLKHSGGCGVLNQQGVIKIDKKTLTVYETIEPCT